jgi:hypothetical protein
MSDNTTPPVATSSSGEIPVEILTAANAHLSHGKTFGGSPGAETPPPLRDGGIVRDAHGYVVSSFIPAIAPPPSVSQEGGMPLDTDALREELAATAGWINAQAHSVGVHLDRIRRASDGLASQSSTLARLRQQLADALLTARYQSDVARQADDAREKAEQERDTAIATAADTIFTTTQAWVEQLGALQAENAGLRAALTQLTVPLYSTRTENAIQRGVRDFARNALADAGPQERP